MEFAYCEGLTGVQPTTTEIEISPSLEIKKGQIIRMGTYGEYNESSKDPILGVAAEDHPASTDPLNPKAGSGKLKIIDSPCAVYRLKVPLDQFAPAKTEGLLTSVRNVIPGGISTARRFALVMASKGEASQNTDEVGTVRHCSDNCESGDGIELCLADEGGMPEMSDRYYVVAGIGSKNVSTSNGTVAFYESQNSDLVVVGRDLELGAGKEPCIYVKIANHVYNGFNIE